MRPDRYDRPVAKDLPRDWICRAGLTRRAHLVGIAGAGMRSLARVLLGWGWKLSGSDLDCSSLGFLKRRRVRVFEGHAPGNLHDHADVLIASDAVPAGNPERRRAAELGIPVLSYFQALGRILSTRRGAAIAGTHGKSTAAAMLAEILTAAGHDPAVIYGASPLGQECGGRPGKGSLTVVEACEYRANFLHLHPRHAAILGIEPDHFDFYRSPGQLEKAFRRFAERIPTDGLLVARQECPVTQRVIEGLTCRVVTFGWTRSAHWSARNLRHRRGRYSFSIHARRKHFCDVSLQIPGQHNVLNALAAAALARESSFLDGGQIAFGLGQFAGLRRRLEVTGTWRGATLIDDYAHHPTEVAAGLETIRQMHPGRRLWCVFQPHQASRTAHLLDELAASLQNADKVIVAEVYRAREPHPKPGEVTARDLARKVRSGGTEVSADGDLETIVQRLESQLRPGDVMVTMGAGDIRMVCDGLLERAGNDRAAG